MITPASIDEADTVLSPLFNHARSPKRNSSSGRFRPRPYVFVSSRRPARAKYLRQKSRSEPSSKRLSVHSEVHKYVSQDDNTCSPNPKLELTPKKPSRIQHHQQQQQQPNGIASDPSGDHLPPFDGDIGNVSPLTPEVFTPQSLHHHATRRSTSNTPPILGAGSLLVEAIARNVAQQLQILSIASPARPNRQDLTDSEEQPPESFKKPSRTSSQQEALDRFTQELERCVEQTGAKGKLPVFTPTPTNSGATLRTVSALLPFRPEFKAAGLAVTSKDQSQPHPHRTKASLMRETRQPFTMPPIKQVRVGQLDGNDNLPSNNTEIPFTAPNKMNEWRYATTDEISPSKSPLLTKSRLSKSQCLPCIPAHDDESSERGCFHILPRSQTSRLVYDPIIKARPIVDCPTSTVPKLAPKSAAPQWAQLTPPHITYPQHPHSNAHIKRKSPTGPTHQVDWGREGPSSSFFAESCEWPVVTGLRRPSIVLSREESKAISPRDRLALDGTDTQKHQTRPTKPGSSVSKLRVARSSKELGRQRVEQPSLKRHQSLPAHRGTHGPHEIDRCKKPLPDLPVTLEKEVAPNDEWIDELPTEVPIEHEIAEEAKAEKAKSPLLEDEYQPQIYFQYVPLCARGYSEKAHGRRPNIPQRMSSIKPGVCSTEREDSYSEISDRDVLRGLHIAASAACNELVDAYIRNQTGIHIRWFLANLVPLETLGDKPLKNVNRQRDKRRLEIRKSMQRTRRSRQMKTPA